MALNTKQMRAGDIITVEKWLKFLGTTVIEKNGKPRNVLAVCKKGKFVVVTPCSKEDAETILTDNGQLVPFKRIRLDEEVVFQETQLGLYTKKFWLGVTTKNCFLGMLDQYEKESDGQETQDASV